MTIVFCRLFCKSLGNLPEFLGKKFSAFPGKMSRDPVFKCEGTSIPLVEQVELLGVTVDKKLKFESQMKKICGKVSQQIAVWKRMNKLLPLKLREKLYGAFTAPHFNYCAKSWNF